ncbi:MBL fold metallo-hydrolase [Marivivens donghaensis]|uniref:MBL fold metallo-hydrolase n=1 Tax=Marivivens donghaensis TaxID=1699413 RepID=A0ABX0VW26_9RHOB|nr:MBL fold metallo-hydrolase [Marivivens donghaensis]NIY71079.1 MBL fold metallo-hydrolase [Marivivens donghaensis]
MAITRRTMIMGTAALAGTLPFRLHASTTVGNYTVDTLSDGNLILPAGFILGEHVNDAADILARYDLGTEQLTPDCNVTLLRDGENTVLIDVGSGMNFQPSAGRLVDSLDTLGVAPEDVTHVLFTHAHPDHLWGVLDDFDEPVFYNARHMIGRAERDYWLDPETVNTIGEERMAFAAGALRYLNAVEMDVFEDGDDVLSGLQAVGTPGHTPGHMAFAVNGSDPLVIVGDSIGNHHVAFEQPQWELGSDQDGELGAATRTALLDRLNADKAMLIGFHFPFPGIGHAEKSGDGYRFIPA